MVLDATLQLRIDSKTLENLKADAKRNQRHLSDEARRRLRPQEGIRLLAGADLLAYDLDVVENAALGRLAAQTGHSSLERIKIGTLVEFEDRVFVLTGKHVVMTSTGLRTSRVEATLQSVDGDGFKKVPASITVGIAARLDERLPPALVAERLTAAEERIIIRLRQGACSLAELYQAATFRENKGFDTRRQHASRVMLGRFAGSLLLTFVAYGLAEFSGDPLSADWRLTERGRQVAAKL